DTDTNNNTALDSTTVNAKPDLVVLSYQFLNEAKDTVISTPNEYESFYIRLRVKNQGGANTGLFYPGVFLDDKPNYGIDRPSGQWGAVTDWSGYRITPPGSVSGVGCMYYDPAGAINPLTTDVESERGNYTRLQFNDALPPGAEVDVDVLIGYPESEYPGDEYNDIRTGLPPGGYDIYLYADPNCSGGDVEVSESNNSYGPISLVIESAPIVSPWVGGVSISSTQDVITVGRPHIGTEIMTYNGVAAGSASVFVPMLFKNMWTGYNAALYVQNLDETNTANLTFTYYDTSGAVSCTKNDTLNAKSSKGYWMPSETCLPASWYGAVRITSDRNIVAVGRPHINGQVTTYNGFASGAATSYVPMLFNQAFGGTYNAALYVQNVTSNTASVSIKFYDSSGSLACIKSDTITQFSSKGYWLPGLVCDSSALLPAGWVGGAVIESSQNIIAVGRPHIGTQVTTYNGFGSGDISMNVPMLFKQAFSTYDSALYVQNVSGVTANITINFYDTDGNLDCTKTDTIATLASKGYWLPTLTCDSGSLPSGWSGGVTITSDQNIVAVGRPHLGSEIMTYSGVAGGALSNFIPMLFNNAYGSYNAAFYVQNLNPTNDALVTIRFYDSSGNLSCVRDDYIRPLASNGYWLPSVLCYPSP
ncbi:MAG: hypothetical protein HXY38_08090, partial [Chloroflexi bacterium]|nr:hypothetical protein [Chloroflexota bacterium]